MTALRQELFDAVKILPEENILSALNYIRKNFLVQPQEKKSAQPDLQNFREIMAKKYGLKENADEIQASIDFIKSLHKFMDGNTADKTLDEWREERLKEKYAEYFD